MRLVAFFLVLVSLLSLPGCAGTTLNADIYDSSASLRAQHTIRAHVVAARRVALAHQNNPAGGLIGAATGGLAGSSVGHGTGRILASVGGALLGLLGGTEIEKHITGRTKAAQITVAEPGGQLKTIIQPAGRTQFHKGQAVLVVKGARTRVEPL